MEAPRDFDEFPADEEARQRAIVTLARFWRKKYPGFTIRTSVPVSEICQEPHDPDLKAVWREEFFDVLAMAGNPKRIALFQVLRSTEEQRTAVLKAIGRVAQEHDRGMRHVI